VDFAAAVHDLRTCGLLRLVAWHTRDEAFSQNSASRNALGNARRPLDVVLYSRSHRRARACPDHNENGVPV